MVLSSFIVQQPCLLACDKWPREVSSSLSSINNVQLSRSHTILVIRYIKSLSGSILKTAPRSTTLKKPSNQGERAIV